MSDRASTIYSADSMTMLWYILSCDFSCPEDFLCDCCGRRRWTSLVLVCFNGGTRVLVSLSDCTALCGRRPPSVARVSLGCRRSVGRGGGERSMGVSGGGDGGMMFFAAAVHLVLLCALQSSIAAAAAADGQRLNEGNTLLWGPGLTDARLSFPVRYFFIQAVDDAGRNITSSLGDDAFELTIANADTNLATRTWAQILDRSDGSYIVRYKMIEGYRNIIISVQHNGKHVSKSPYYIKGPIFQEKCYCPIQKLSKWLELMKCPSGYKQIHDDLSVFSKIDMKSASKEIVQKFNERGRHSLCHYVIKKNMVVTGYI